MYKRIFVGDGKFKADHVRQINEVDDVWLSEGSGMIPKREEYFSFLASAIERLTVSAISFHMFARHLALLGPDVIVRRCIHLDMGECNPIQLGGNNAWAGMQFPVNLI